jgi:hypothetical protein
LRDYIGQGEIMDLRQRLKSGNKKMSGERAQECDNGKTRDQIVSNQQVSNINIAQQWLDFHPRQTSSNSVDIGGWSVGEHVGAMGHPSAVSLHRLSQANTPNKHRKSEPDKFQPISCLIASNIAKLPLNPLRYVHHISLIPIPLLCNTIERTHHNRSSPAGRHDGPHAGCSLNMWIQMCLRYRLFALIRTRD